MREQLELASAQALPQFVHLDTVATAHLTAEVREFLGERGASVPVILSINESISRLLATRPRHRRMLRRLELMHLVRAERRAYPRVDAVDVVTAEDADYVANLVPQARVRVIPLGVETPPDAALVADDRSTDVLLFDNDLDRPELLESFIPALLRERPGTRIRIVGSLDPLSPAGATYLASGAEPLGFVDDLSAVLLDTRVLVAPSQQRSGTPNKARDGMAHGAAVVGGACLTGLPGFESGRHGFIVTDAKHMATTTACLLGDEDLRLALVDNGLALVDAIPDWGTVGRQYAARLPTPQGARR